VGSHIVQDKPLKSHGLYLGKFAPLHLGHEFMIKEALRTVEKLTVLIYEAPGVTEIPLVQRANWIRALNPEIEVIECGDGPTDVTYESAGMREHELYVIEKLGGRKITHFFSSEQYGEHMSEALPYLDDNGLFAGCRNAERWTDAWVPIEITTAIGVSDTGYGIDYYEAEYVYNDIEKFVNEFSKHNIKVLLGDLKLKRLLQS
jgi:cytidyltransferase-like protein